LDHEMAAALRPKLPPNVSLVEQDVLDFDLLSIADRDLRVAGNLPYNVSSPILFRLVNAYRTRGGILDATVMVQQEVAARIAASPGTRDYGVLSILIQLHADVARIMTLPPGAFRPPPKVRSEVIRLRRKTLHNSMRAYAEGRGSDADDALRVSAIDPTRRPETLQLTELARLADFFASRSR
jgi:16S rRNA (adenine1518-N6/adenine1519-N6)-dimethyltransferase